MESHLRFRVFLALAVSGIAISGCGAGKRCPIGCPATYMSIVLLVMSSPDGGAVSDVGVAFSGPSTGSMQCKAEDTATACWWPSEPVIEGTYLLEISAPGYKTAKVDATMAIIPDPQCGCTGAELKPSEVTLDSV